MREPLAVFEQSTSAVWIRFQEVVHPQILAAPRISWDQVDRKLMHYINNSVDGTPWVNHLAFLLAVLICHTQLDLKTVRGYLQGLNARFKTIFQAYGLTRFSEWDPEVHVPRYMKDPELKNSLRMQNEFLTYYTGSARHLQTYLHSLPAEERLLYQRWVLPPLPPGMSERLQQNKVVQEVQAMRRKAESDAVTPHFGLIRGEAHMRWNELHRLRQKFREVVGLVQSGKTEPPVFFSYEEPRRGLRLHFTLWDRPSFVLAPFHRYHPRTVWSARNRCEGFLPERNHYFLEFTGADHLNDVTPPRDPDALLWFGDLLRYGVMGRHTTSGTAEQVQRKQAYLRSWGYGTEESEEESTPFNPEHPGLLVGSHAEGTSDFMDHAQERTDGLLLLVEPLFAAATFGLACLDFFTTTGARLTELLQLSLSPDCLYTMEVGGTQRLLVKLIPKGTDKPAEYMIGPETRRNLERVMQLLKDHYGLQPGDILPHVSFHPENTRAHIFTNPRPYLFQYHSMHLHHKAITACMRFLMHGMVFQDAAGNVVVLKAHLLRHVFATHLHQVEKVPLDIVAKILHQKDVQVTAYYAAPQWQQIVETTDSLLDRFASHLGNVEEAFVRAPAELQRQLEDAKNKVGALAKVPGGECTCYALCPFSFVCTGCVYKVPDPDREEEVIEQEHWAFIRLEQVKRRGMGPETVRMEALLERCKVEREEMRLIREYRKDETCDSPICIESREEHQPSVVEAVPPGQARADGATGQGHRRSAAQRRANGHA
jgi:hypothetical protein